MCLCLCVTNDRRYLCATSVCDVELNISDRRMYFLQHRLFLKRQVVKLMSRKKAHDCTKLAISLLSSYKGIKLNSC